MKKLIVLFLILLISGLAVSVEAAKKTIAVMPLENASKYDKVNVAEIMTEEILIALKNSGQYSVLERIQMETILKEQGFQNISTDPNTTVQFGKLVGANYSLVGKITMVNVKHDIAKKLNLIFSSGLGNDVSSKIGVDIRFIDNETGELIFAKSFTGSESGKSTEEALHNVCKEIAENFLMELTSDLSGRIIDVSNKEVYIDQGSDNGVRKGDIFLIFRETEPIKIGGEIVDMKKIQIGKLKVTSVHNKYSICKITDDKRKYPIQKGDFVKKE